MEEKVKEMLNELFISREITLYKLFRVTIGNDWCETAINKLPGLLMSSIKSCDDDNDDNKKVLTLVIRDNYNIATALIEFLLLYKSSGARLHSVTMTNIETCLAILARELKNYELQSENNKLDKDTYTLYFSEHSEEFLNLVSKYPELFRTLLIAAAESSKIREELVERMVIERNKK